MNTIILSVLAFLLVLQGIIGKDTFDNIDGYFAVPFNHHYSNKSSIVWGHNSQKDFSVKILLSLSAAIYDCTNTTKYSCEDSAFMYDWNKLWGKARCGYYHDHHEDSDRFVFRKCSDASCSSFDVNHQQRIEIGAYSYDGGVPPYTGENPDLMKSFKTTIDPEKYYIYQIIMDESGLSTFILRDENSAELERQTVQHKVLCEDNYFEGTVNGLYFGGTCAAPIEVDAHYIPV